MKLIYKYWKRLLACLIVVLVVAGIIIYVNYQDINVSADEESENCIEMYESVIEPAMLSGSVSTKFILEEGNNKTELRYAMSGVDSLVSYYTKDQDGNEYLFELWNNLEQYYLRTIIDGKEEVYKVEADGEDKDKLVDCVYQYYITGVAYLGVASKERIKSFEKADENTYLAKSSIEDAEYSLRFVLSGDLLTDIYMFEDTYTDRVLDIHFDKFNITDQSEYEETSNTCDVDHVLEAFKYNE